MRHYAEARLNVLLTQDRPHGGEHWTQQLPRLLEPLGVASYVAGSAQEAIDLVEHMPIHAAVIDLSTPMGQVKPARGGGASGGGTAARIHGPAGFWLLELFRRLPDRPPVVVLHSPALSRKEIDRMLREALRLGAFSVLNKPVQVEQLLDVFRRMLDREYRGGWPNPGGPPRDGENRS